MVKLVSHQFGPRLYADLVVELKKSTELILERPASPILPYIASQYPKYVDYLLLVRHVFLALDRPYVWEDATSSAALGSNTITTNGAAGAVVKRTSQASGLLEVGLQQFASRLRELNLDVELYEAWWDLLWSNFEGQETSNLLDSTMSIWSDLQWKFQIIQKTQPRFEQALKQVSQNWQQQPYSAENFLAYVHQQWMFVSQVWSFLPKTWLRTLLEVHLLEPHLNNEFLLHELDVTNLQHCQKMWLLAARLDGGLTRVLHAVCQLTKKEGLACLGKEPKGVVQGLLDLQERLQRLQEVVGDLPLKPVWTDVLNDEPSAVAEYLAKHVDGMFRNSKAIVRLEPVLQLFCLLQAKDVFEAFYKKDLAKRLLLNRVQSMDVERQFVSLLKAECGAGYTSKIEGMFQDIEWSRETMARYRSSPEHAEHRSGDGAAGVVDMDVQILTTGYWPVYTQYPKLVLPTSMRTPQHQFWSHYKQKYQGRKIVWQYALGNCSVRFTLRNKQYDLIVSLCQALVLLCFNGQASKTLGDVSKEIGFGDLEELERIVQSLSLGKEGTRVLKRTGPRSSGKGPAIHISDALTVNDKFTSPHRRIRINNLLKKKVAKEASQEERDKVLEAVSRDRLYLMDAVLVRIMKARKTILHQQLIPQVLEQIKFHSQPSDIKKRIESLIEREYMERDAKDRNRYNYLA